LYFIESFVVTAPHPNILKLYIQKKSTKILFLIQNTTPMTKAYGAMLGMVYYVNLHTIS